MEKDGEWLEIIRAHHRRSRNIVIDWCRKFARYIVLKARRTKVLLSLKILIDYGLVHLGNHLV